jgi:GTP cyclohydrolase I
MRNDPVANHIEGMLVGLGQDPVQREGTKETPERAAKAWREWLSGYHIKPEDVFKSFEDGAEKYDEMVVVKEIPFYSHCEHHLASIFGTAAIAYIPDKRVIGLSKLPRIVDIFARRLQVQERMTVQIADAVETCLQPIGVGVILRARHLCMESRGINKPGAITITSALRGAIKASPQVRAEFLRLAE